MLESLRPDPTFYPSPRIAMEAPAERLAYTLLLSPDHSKPDALAVVDVDRGSPNFGKAVYRLDMPYRGDEFHHFGWNACSSALSPFSSHPFVERRYLIIPGIRSSRIYIVDTKPDPARADNRQDHRARGSVPPRPAIRAPTPCTAGPRASMSARSAAAAPTATQGPPGVFIMDCETFDILGRWEIDRGPQKLHYDFWWNLPRNYMVTSEWGLPPQFENGVVPEDLLANKYGHAVHFWDLAGRKNVQTIDLGANHQMVLEVRPAHDPAKEYGFLGVVVDTTNLEGSIWTWRRENGKFTIAKTAIIPPEPADKALLPDLLKGFGAVPPLVTDIDLSLDDRFLYVACWGTGELRQYDVSDPMKPKLAGSVKVGGIVARRRPSQRPAVRRRAADGRDQPRRQARLFHQLALQRLGPAVLSEGVRGVQVMCNADPNGGIDARSGFLRRIRRGLRLAPDSARGRRLLDGFVLLSVRLTDER